MTRWRSLLAASGAYLVLGVVVWWNAWTAHPAATATCGCGDASLFIWFVQWPAYALAHGADPLYSTALFHPTGINLLANTGVLAIGIPLAPVTWLFGPVASVNVASTLIPALSAVAMFWLVRRWVSWAPAAFVAGLLYGFSPYVVTGLAAGWLTTLMVVPPLVVACLDELLVRQRHRPVPVGIVLGLLVIVQFWLASELLAIMAVVALVGLVLLAAYAALRQREDLRRRLPHAAAGLATGGALALVALAWPAWFALAGPAHFTGLVWPFLPPGSYGLSLPSFWQAPPSDLPSIARQFGGYQGPSLPPSWYLGSGLMVVVVVGTAVWFRDRRLWLFGAVGAVSVTLCLGVDRAGNGWVPWRLLARIPVIQNVIPSRFVAMTVVCVAVMLGVIVDRAYGSVAQWLAPPDRREPARPRRLRWPQVAATAVAGAVALAAVVPIATSYAGNIPLVMEPVVLPQWFAQVAPHLPAGQVVLPYPAPFSNSQSAVTWQAVDRMRFAMPGGSGPGGIAARAGRERPGFDVLSDAAFSFGPPPAPSAARFAAVRHALAGWGVTTVVIPDQPELPQYDRGTHTAYAVGLFTAVLGERPRYRAHAWVWSGVDAGRRTSLAIAPAAFSSCVGSGDYRAGPPETVPDCVLGAVS